VPFRRPRRCLRRWRTGGAQGVLDAVLLFLQFNLGGGADLYDRDSTGELGETLLELLAVPVRIGVLDLTLDLGDASRDVGVCTAAVDDGRGVLGDDDATAEPRGPAWPTPT